MGCLIFTFSFKIKFIKFYFLSINNSMSKSRIDLAVSKISNLNEIQAFADELKKSFSYQKASNNDLINENKRILDILRNIDAKIDKQLQIHKKNMLLINPNHKVTFSKDQMKLLQEKQTNNIKLLAVLEKDLENVMARKKLHEEGLEEKIRQKKNILEDKIVTAKLQLKKLTQSQKESEKKLQAYENISEVDYLKQYARMEEELRIFSAKYVKIVARYNKVTEQLAVSSQVKSDFQIPEQIYNNDLDQKQQAQFKQYQSIVKLCTILSKRNDSENNKNNRIYTEKLKELEKTILNLTELQKSIAFRETQILQGKKNIEMIRLKLNNQEKVDKQLFRLSQGSKNSFGDELRKKSYSSVKLSIFADNQSNSNNKLRSRGMSFVKLPEKLKS